jgi:dolichol-phosphate mannosyltransferase
MNSAALELSIVIPIFNEHDNIEILLEEIRWAVDPLQLRYEIIAVDDKSTDGSLPLLERLAQEKRELVVVKHRTNCGESAGQATGFRVARGEAIVTIDGDRQNDPADIPKLLETLSKSVDCVCGVRRTREDDWIKRCSSRIGNGFRNLITGDRISDAGCTYRAIRRSALREIPVFNGMHRFLPTILRLQGYNVVELPVNHRPRVAGVSKYGVGNRMWRGIVDCIAMRWYRARAVSGSRMATARTGAAGSER